MSETFNVNGLNQVISAALGSITYDARGNTVSAGSKSYGYDVFNQLTSVSGAGTNATMTYDPVGRMASVTGTSTTTQFGYSGSQLIVEYNSSGTVLRRYVHGVGSDNPIVWYEGSGTSTRKWLMTDQQGSVTGVTNNSGVVTHKNTYNEYGVPALSNIGRFQYTGQVWLAEAQIYHYKARAYDPYLGRFLQTDPIGYAAGMNMYAYVGGDPVNFRDPSGLSDCQPGEDCIVVTGTRRTTDTEGFDLLRDMYAKALMDSIKEALDRAFNATTFKDLKKKLCASLVGRINQARLDSYNNGKGKGGVSTHPISLAGQERMLNEIQSKAKNGMKAAVVKSAWSMLVSPGAPFDHKAHFFGDQNPRSPEKYGNTSYGYTGSHVGFSEGQLLVASQLVSLIKAGRFDDDFDINGIKLGVAAYAACR